MKIGEDYIGVTCVFFCHDGNGNILMHKRSKNCRDEIGKWDVGAGTMEFGETFEEAVRREIKEEYCSDVRNLKFLGVHNVLRKNGKKDTHWIALLFVAQVNPEQVKIGDMDKMEKLGWFAFNKLPSSLHSQIPRWVELVKKEVI